MKRNVGKIKESTLFLYAGEYYCVSLHNMSILYRGQLQETNHIVCMVRLFSTAWDLPYLTSKAIKEPVKQGEPYDGQLSYTVVELL